MGSLFRVKPIHTEEWKAIGRQQPHSKRELSETDVASEDGQ